MPNCDKFDERFIIVDNNGKTVDDAQGWGYKSKQKASKAMWYKFKGGKTKIGKEKAKQGKIVKQFEQQYKGIGKSINDILEWNVKEIMRGEVDDSDIISCLKEEFGVELTEYELKCFYNQEK